MSTSQPRRTQPRARKRKDSRPRAAGRVKAPPPEWFQLHPMLKEAGVYVTPDTASQVAAVYGCCRLIVDCLAPAPILVTEIQAGGVRKDRPDDPTAWTLNHGAPVSVAPDGLPAQAIEEALYWSALLDDGNGYAEIQRDMADRPVALWPLDSCRVTPRRDTTGFFYEYVQPNGDLVRIEPRDMFHLRGPSLKGWMGDSVVYRAAKAIGIAHASQVYSAAYFSNGTVISGLLTSDKVITPAQAKDAKGRWQEDHGGGPGKAHGVSVLGSGIKYQPINHNAQESMLVESRRFQVQEIARFFGVPTTLLADNEAWTNLGELYLGFYRNALRPWAERFDAEATRKLFPQRMPWREVSHDLTHLTLGSFKDQVAALVQATGNKAIWTVNEARALFGKNAVEGGDEVVPEPPEMPEPVEPARPEAPEEPEDDEPEPARPERRGPTARDALVLMFAGAFERHVRRTKNRAADVKRELTDADRLGLTKRLAEDCDAALDLARRGLDGQALEVDLAAYAGALDAGEPPDKAAERVVTAVWSG